MIIACQHVTGALITTFYLNLTCMLIGHIIMQDCVLTPTLFGYFTSHLNTMPILYI